MAGNYSVFNWLEESCVQFAGVEGWLDWLEAHIVYISVDSKDRLQISLIYFTNLLEPRYWCKGTGTQIFIIADIKVCLSVISPVNFMLDVLGSTSSMFQHPQIKCQSNQR